MTRARKKSTVRATRKASGSGPAKVPVDADARSWLTQFFDGAGLPIARLDGTGKIVDGNAALASFLGRPLDDLSGRSLVELAAADEAEQLSASLAAARHSGRCESRDVRFVRQVGTPAWGALTISRITEPATSGFIAVLQDVSERKSRESELVHQAFHDSLTGLANRALFRDRVDHAMAHGSRDGDRVAVLFIDLDDFKAINDTQGHTAGDRVLQHVARTLLSATRGCDTVARLGGDEFAVLLERVNEYGGPEVAAQRIVNALARPVETEPGRFVTIRVSIGIARHGPDDGRDELLRSADVALYESKARARGRWVTYDPAMHAALVDRVALESDLRAAIDRCLLRERPNLESTGRYPQFDAEPAATEITLAYQPIVDVGTEQLLGFEALARWSHGERGDIPPITFIPMAEETGLILSLGRWVLRRACRQAAAWNAASQSPLTITVNLSGRQLQDELLVGDVGSALADSGLSPSLLVLEMTESVIMQEPSSIEGRLRALKALGVRIAIDDFGTGYSSLSHLQQFPVDILKIDRSFLHRMRQGTHDAALVRTIVALARMLSLRTVAEGVEDSHQREQLRELGCDSAQGFLFGRPMNVEKIDAMFAAGTLPLPR